MNKVFYVKETNNATGCTRYIKTTKHTSRGWTVIDKQFNTERAAKSWITRRIKELTGSVNENTWTYEVVAL